MSMKVVRDMMFIYIGVPKQTLMKLLSISMIALTLLGCYSKKDSVKPIELTSSQIDSITRAPLLASYRALTSADTTFTFTSELQDKLNNESMLLLVSGKIKDVIKRDSMYIMIVAGKFKNRDALSHISVSPEQLPAMKSQHKSKGYFLIKASHLSTSTNLEMVNEYNPRYEDYDIGYDLGELFYQFNGSLVDYRFQ